MRYEIRDVDVFLPGDALIDSEWAQHVAAIVRVRRDTRRQNPATGLWSATQETAYHVSNIVLGAKEAADAIRHHWAIENRLHYVRDVSFAEDMSRIRKSPGIFARVRSFAANILRFNGVENMASTRYRIALGGLDALTSLRFM